ncbi:MAG: PIN domain-containing protein [Myxococcales bacterium]|nr:PIN domain-containing protein [Myxococcales bacterium]
MLVYARRAESPLHVSAVAVLRDLAEGLSPWGIPIFCVTEFFRVVTHPRLFEPPSSPDGAIAFIAALLASPTARLLLPGPRYWHVFQELVADGSITGNLAFDAQIAAVCVENGAGELITEDRDFNRFSGLRTRRLA